MASAHEVGMIIFFKMGKKLYKISENNILRGRNYKELKNLVTKISNFQEIKDSWGQKGC